jgi:hypothetical protein
MVKLVVEALASVVLPNIVGEVRTVEEAKTAGPVPTSSDKMAASSAEVVNDELNPRVEVLAQVGRPLETMRTWPVVPIDRSAIVPAPEP